MTIYQITSYNNLNDLEADIIKDFGRTVDRKDAKIQGTVLQLEKLGLGHNQSIWGVPVVANNYQPSGLERVVRNKKVRP